MNDGILGDHFLYFIALKMGNIGEAYRQAPSKWKAGTLENMKMNVRADGGPRVADLAYDIALSDDASLLYPHASRFQMGV